jgi:hypothetical protein
MISVAVAAVASQLHIPDVCSAATAHASIAQRHMLLCVQGLAEQPLLRPAWQEAHATKIKHDAAGEIKTISVLEECHDAQPK